MFYGLGVIDVWCHRLLFFLFFYFWSAYMFIEFDLRPFSAVLSDLFIFVDNFYILANKSALNRLILRHCYFRVCFMSVDRCLCACSCAYAYVRMWVCGWCFWG